MNHNINNYFILMLWVCLITSCKVSKYSNTQTAQLTYAIDFEDAENLNAVIDIAKNKYKLVFLDVSASWSEPCQIMSKEVYTDKKVADFFNENFINYRIDAEQGEGPDIKMKYGINDYPTLLLLNRRGEIIHRSDGGMSPEDLIDFGQKGLEMSPTM